jgi:hypothetical protein
MADGFATMGAALIGAGIAVVGLILGKENKISEFRQQWIDGLRNDVSTLIGVSVAIRIRPIDQRYHGELSLQLFELEQRIALRFKKDSDESAELLKAVRAISAAALRDAHDLIFTDLLFRVRNATHNILEFEWKRVKAGEPAYRRTLFWTRVFAATLGGALALWGIGLVLMQLIVWLPALFKG